ncbi:hypothetical protein MRX96_015516, partial [Rhipicephalus microplus]
LARALATPRSPLGATLPRRGRKMAALRGQAAPPLAPAPGPFVNGRSRRGSKCRVEPGFEPESFALLLRDPWRPPRTRAVHLMTMMERRVLLCRGPP